MENKLKTRCPFVSIMFCVGMAVMLFSVKPIAKGVKDINNQFNSSLQKWKMQLIPSRDFIDKI